MALAGSGIALGLGRALIFAQDTTASATPALDPATEARWIKYNLNTITDAQILTIPAAGDRMTREFAEYRPYTTIGQFRAEIGKYVDDDVVAGYERYLFVPVDPNEADSDTLQQLPGVSEDISGALTDGRPYADNTAFLAALGEHVSAEQAALAPAYLTGTAGDQVEWIKYNLDTITADQVITIPSAGDRMSREFAEYRPWTSVSQFRAEIGKYVDDDVVSGFLRYVFVPVDHNAADAETLQQLPGVSAEIADALTAARPFADANAFLTALAAQVAPEQATLASSYLKAQ
jgi:DNA uptake protein ComE-like DNA-binding protein